LAPNDDCQLAIHFCHCQPPRYGQAFIVPEVRRFVDGTGKAICTSSAAPYLAFWRLLRCRVLSDSNAEVDAIRALPASLPINILAFLHGYQAWRGFLFSAVFALFNGILSCGGGA
jgi:hypothetical protein